MQHLSRRSFLQNTSLAFAGTTLLPWSLQTLDRPVHNLGVQLWSVRNDMADNAVKTLEAIAKMGFRQVEGFGYNEGEMFGMTTTEYLNVLKNNGLSMPSSHCGFSLSDYDEGQKTLSDRAKRAIDDAVAMGQRYVIFPWVNEQERTEVERLVRLTSAAAAYARKAGIRFGYHNHDFEFTLRGPDGRLLIEWLLHEIDPKTLCFEMDIYWVCYAGHNPLDWFRIYPGRWELCHAKDLAKTEQRETIEFGDGNIDFPAIFRQSQQAGLQHYIIELEHYRSTPLEGIKRARQNFVQLNW